MYVFNLAVLYVRRLHLDVAVDVRAGYRASHAAKWHAERGNGHFGFERAVSVMRLVREKLMIQPCNIL